MQKKFSQPLIEGGKGRHLLGIEVVDILNHDVSQNVFLATNRVNLMNGHHVCFHTLLSSCLHETLFFSSLKLQVFAGKILVYASSLALLVGLFWLSPHYEAVRRLFSVLIITKYHGMRTTRIFGFHFADED
jgi:hypothetical protein